MPILQIHGTVDGVVPYGGAIWTKSIDEVIAYWVDYNNWYNSSESYTDRGNSFIARSVFFGGWERSL